MSHTEEKYDENKFKKSAKKIKLKIFRRESLIKYKKNKDRKMIKKKGFILYCLVLYQYSKIL